jgi:putative MATE family efflux protein
VNKKKRNIFFESLKHEERDYTKGSIGDALILLAVPMILEMAMEALFAIVDTFFVSRISTEAVATIGITESLLMILESIAIGVAMAGTAMIARRIGEKNVEGAKKVVANVVTIAVMLSVSIGALCFIFAGDILRLMGSEESLIEAGQGYTAIILGFNVFLTLLFVLNGIFRGAGNATIAMRSLWLANGLNIVLDPLLIFGLGSFAGFGLEGAAIATCIGRGTGVVYQFYHLFRGDTTIKIGLKDWVLSSTIMRKIIDIGAGGAGQFLIATASWIFLVRIINNFGSDAVAGYTIAIRIIIFTILPSWGLSNAVATLVGQNLGAKNPDRAEKTVWKAGWYNMLFMGSVSVLFFLIADKAVALFSQDPVVIAHGAAALKILVAGYIFFAYQMVLGQAFNGAGDTRTPTIMNFSILWLIQIPLAYTLSNVLEMGPTGVYFSIGISSACLASLAIYLFRKGKWKDKVI